MFHYQLYGLEVSSDLELAGLGASACPDEADVVCHLKPSAATLQRLEELRRERPAWVSPLTDSHDVPVLRIWRSTSSGEHCFQYCEGLAFLIDGDGRKIGLERPDGVTTELITGYLIGHILAFVLHLRGCVCLHASAVAIDGRAAVFAGDPGRGKSSTAAAFAERGWPVLADDVSALRREADGRIVVLPGPPRVCLLPDSAEYVYGAGAAEKFPEVFLNEEKRLVRLDTAPGKYQREPTPLAAVYLLAPRTDEPSAPRIEPIAEADSLVEILKMGFVSETLDSSGRGREFRLQGEISRAALVRRLVPSRDLEKLGLLCELVEEEVRAAGRARVTCADEHLSPTSSTSHE